MMKTFVTMAMASLLLIWGRPHALAEQYAVFPAFIDDTWQVWRVLVEGFPMGAAVLF